MAGPTTESIPVVTTKALDIDPPPGLLSGVSHSAHPKTTEQSVEPSSGVSQPAHPATIEPPPGLLTGVSCSAHPESSSIKAVKSEAMLPSVSSPKMALLYASASMHRALTANANQANRCSINRYLGWPRVSLSIGIPGYGEEEGDVHVSNDDNKRTARNSSNYDCHSRRYDRTLLLNVWNNSDLYVWDPWIYTVHPGFPHLIDCRELDLPIYDGKYRTPTDHTDHFTTPNNQHTKLLSTTSVCQMSTTRLADINTTK